MHASVTHVRKRQLRSWCAGKLQDFLIWVLRACYLSSERRHTQPSVVGSTMTGKILMRWMLVLRALETEQKALYSDPHVCAERERNVGFEDMVYLLLEVLHIGDGKRWEELYAFENGAKTRVLRPSCMKWYEFNIYNDDLTLGLFSIPGRWKERW